MAVTPEIPEISTVVTWFSKSDGESYHAFAASPSRLLASLPLAREEKGDLVKGANVGDNFSRSLSKFYHLFKYSQCQRSHTKRVQHD